LEAFHSQASQSQAPDHRQQKWDRQDLSNVGHVRSMFQNAARRKPQPSNYRSSRYGHWGALPVVSAPIPTGAARYTCTLQEWPLLLGFVRQRQALSIDDALASTLAKVKGLVPSCLAKDQGVCRAGVSVSTVSPLRSEATVACVAPWVVSTVRPAAARQHIRASYRVGFWWMPAFLVRCRYLT
jgi:hypothetical protein